MNKDKFADEAAAIVHEAAAWIAQLETGELSATDQDALREWLRRSPRHAAELRRLAQLSRELNVLTEAAGPLQTAASRYQPLTSRHRSRSGQRLFAVAAFTALALLICGVILFQFHRSPPHQPPQIVATAIGDYRQLQLGDGTVIHLNTDTQLEVSERRARLLAGEAYFDVAPDPQRPFLAYVGTRRIRVLGTAFLVSLIAEEFQLTVAEGKVELTQTAQADAQPGPVVKSDAGEGNHPDHSTRQSTQSATQPTTQALIMQAGQSIQLSPQQTASPLLSVSARELQRQLSWQQGLLDFSNAPLAEVVKQLNRYSALQIELVDPGLDELRFGGIFRTGETEGLLDALQSTFGIKVDYVNDSKVRLSRLGPDSARNKATNKPL